MIARLVLLLVPISAAAVTNRYLVFHKPVGLVTTHKDELGRKTVYDALCERLPPKEAQLDWHACGRLDMETSGLLIMTTDGRLVRHVTDPTAGLDPLLKRYVCRCHQLDDRALTQLRQGVDLGGGLGMSMPAEVSRCVDDDNSRGKQSVLEIGIREGKNRQIRRMLHAVGSGVIGLHRTSIGALELGTLAEGEFRWLSAQELLEGLCYPPAADAAALMPTPRDADADGYALLDSGDFARLESFGGHLVERPCPSASWPRGAQKRGGTPWKSAPLRFTQGAAGAAGEWVGKTPSGEYYGGAAAADGDSHVTATWQLDSGAGFVLALQPGPSGQLGAFPEQRANWRWLHDVCRDALSSRTDDQAGSSLRDGDDISASSPRLRVLNLFGHTGGSSLACAAGAAAAVPSAIEVVHVDGAKSAVSRARANAELSGLAEVPVRWICEDVVTFCRRAAKRGERFDGIIVDPPAFGRGGKKGTEWRIQRDMPKLLSLLAELLPDTPTFVLVTCHDHRWPSARLREAIEEMLAARTAAPPGRRGRGGVEHGRMVLRATESGGKDLPMGAFARWRAGEE